MKIMNPANVGHYLRILRHLVPALRSFVVQAVDGRVLASSGGTAAPILRACLDALVARLLRSPSDSHCGVRLLRENELTYVLILRDTVGTPLGLLALVSDSSTVRSDTPSIEAIAQTTAAVVSLLVRELEMGVPAPIPEIAAAQGAERQLQRAIEQIQTADHRGFDRPEALLVAVKGLFGCDVAMLFMPACGVERLVGCVSAGAAGAEQLRRLVKRHLHACVRHSGKTKTFNQRRESSDTALVPFRVLCAPLKRRDVIVGVIAIANPLRAPPFDPRDSQLLEELTPTLHGIVGASYDADTGLLTRQAFEEEAANRLAEDGLLPRCVVYCDVGCSEAIDAMRGLPGGDDAVRAAARVWHHALFPGGVLISRLSGDRFAALLENCTVDQARVWAERVRVALAETRQTNASLGISRVTADQTLNSALTAAGIACKAANLQGRNRVELFDDIDSPAMQRHTDRRVSRDAVDALDVSRLRLYAQPLVSFADPGQPTHYEILVGTNDDRGSGVAPNQSMPVATPSHLRTCLDKWVLTQAVAQLNRNRAAFQTERTVFWVNLSSQSLADPEFAHFAYEAVRDSEVASGSIAFGITESAAIGNLHAAQRFIARLMELECRFALDEFGSGLASLKLLNDLQVSMLKIDGCFIRDVSHDPRLDSVVRTVLQVARELGLETVAKCIESPAAANHVAALGVTFGQGCELGQPEPLKEVLEALCCRPRNLWQRLRASVPDLR